MKLVEKAARPGPWTIKLVAQADRDMIAAAARRAQQSTGPWLVEAARQRIAAERVSRIGPPGEDMQAPAVLRAGPEGGPPAGPSAMCIPELVSVLRDLRDVPRCGRIASHARRLLSGQLKLLAEGLPAHGPPLLSAEQPAKG